MAWSCTPPPVTESVATLAAWAHAHPLARVGGLVSLGGDGTMLGAMRLVIDRPVPVLGVNHGNLGFLVEVNPSALPQALEQLSRGDFTVESHGCLVADGGPVELTTRFGFNDVVLARLGRTGACWTCRCAGSSCWS